MSKTILHKKTVITHQAICELIHIKYYIKIHNEYKGKYMYWSL